MSTDLVYPFLIQSLPVAWANILSLLQKKVLSYDVRMAGFFFFVREGIQLCCNVLDSIGGAES